MLDRWLNGKDGDDTDTEEEEEEVVEAKRGAGKRGSDDGAEGEGNVKRARRSLS